MIKNNKTDLFKNTKILKDILLEELSNYFPEKRFEYKIEDNLESPLYDVI